MALLFFDGFETLPSVRPAWVIASPVSITGRTGAGSKALAQTSGNGARIGFTPSATVIAGVAKRVGTDHFGATSGQNLMLAFSADNGALAHLGVYISSIGQIQVRRGTGGGAVILATSTLTISPEQWFYLEMKGTIADAGGTCIIRVNGIEYINFTGDTRNPGTSTSIDALSIGTYIASGNSTNATDDLVIMNDTSGSFNDFIGDRTIRAIRPNGNGATNQWVGSDADSTDNYLLVDEDPFSSADYTGSPTVGDRDIYAFNDLSINGTVDAVQVLSYAAKSDAGARTIKTLTRSIGGTVLASSAAALQTTYGVVDSPILLTDADAAAWTVASVNSAQYGVEVGA